MFKTEWLKTQWIHVIEHRNNIMNTLLESLHEITSMLCSQEHGMLATWIEHHVVAEFLVKNYAKVMLFCDIVVNDVNKATLQNRYCEIHNLDIFPAPFTPTQLPPAAPPTNQELPVPLRGGGGEDDDLNSTRFDGIGLSEDEGFCTAATFEVDGSPRKDTQPAGAELPPFTQREAESPEKQPSQGEQPNNAGAAVAAGGLGVGHADASGNHTPAATDQQRPAVTPANSILRRPGNDIATNLNVRFENDNDETGNCTMRGNMVGLAGGTANPYSVAQQNTDAVGNLRPTMNEIKHLLDGIYEQVYVKPREVYKQRVPLKETFEYERKG